MTILTNLLTAASDAVTSSGAGSQGGGWQSYIFLGVLVLAFVVMMFVSNRNNKKKQQEQQDTIKALRPGNKVKTYGGICGIVVEVLEEENAFVMETGSEISGKSFLKVDLQAIFQTDAKAEKSETAEEAPVEEPVEETTETEAE